MRKLLALFTLSMISLQGASVRLLNEATCPLKARVYSASGAFLGEVAVVSGSERTWSEPRKEMIQTQGPTKSITPFTIHWVCPDGEIFSSVEGVSTGSLVFSNQGSGKKHCVSKEKK